MTDARTHDRTGGSGAPSHAQSVLLTWGPTLFFAALLPWITYHQLTGHGVRGAPAIVLVSAWPALEIGLYFALHYRVDEFGALTLAALLLAAAIAGAGGGRPAGARTEAAYAGLVGAAFAASLVFGRPLTFWFGRRFATDGSTAGAARWGQLWLRDAGFRDLHRRVTAVWAAGCILDAGAVAVCAARLPDGGVEAVSIAGPLVVTATLVTCSVHAGKTWAAVRQTPAAPSSTPTA